MRNSYHLKNLFINEDGELVSKTIDGTLEQTLKDERDSFLSTALSYLVDAYFIQKAMDGAEVKTHDRIKAFETLQECLDELVTKNFV